MEELKQKFAHDYNEAIENYNNGDCVLFFRNIRPAIESFCRIVIYDLLGKDLATKVLNGEKRIDCDFKSGVSSIACGSNNEVLNSLLATVAKQAIYHVKGATLVLQDRPVVRIKKAIDSDFMKLSSDFGNGSEAGSHSGKTSMELEVEASNLSTFMPKVFSDLRTILSNDTIEFLATLNKPLSNVIFLNSNAERAVETNNDFILLNELTNNFEQSAGTNYVAIVPEHVNDSYGHKLSCLQLQDFYRLNWRFVVDLNPKEADGLYHQAPAVNKSSIRIITDNKSEISGSSEILNWLFAKGRIDLAVYDEKKIIRETPKFFSSVFSKLVKTGLTNEYLIFDFCEDFPKFSIKLFEKLEDVFGSWDAVSKRCKIISFTKSVDYKTKLEEWSEDYGVSCTFVSATFCDFLNYIVSIKPTLSNVESNKLLIRGNSLDLTESWERYKAAGIEFYGPAKTNCVENRKWDFYSGAEITWDELDKQYDVIRERYRLIKQRVSEILRTTRRASIFTLRHRPGSGATTLARRLGYDFKKEDEAGTISCTVIDIKNSSNIKLTESYLCQLSEQTENTVILAIVESKHVGREKFDNLVKRMADRGKKILFFYVEPFTGRYNPPKENVVLLDSVLRHEELKRFEEKYISLGLDSNYLNDVKKHKSQFEVVDFPLMLKDEETSANLSTYVSEWMDELPENLRQFCAFVGFVFKYSDLGVNQMLLRNVWRDEFHSSIMSYTESERLAISKLLIEETSEEGKALGIWRPRYNKFSEFILSSYKVNWLNGLSDIAKDFINLCQNAGELGSDDRDMLYSVFIIRKNADYRAVEERRDLKNKFSLLIKDLDDIERSEALFNNLVEAFPNDSVFRGHFARFLYEKTSLIKGISTDDRLFDDAQMHLSLAFDLNPNDADLHHMQGMLLRRKIAVLSKMYAYDISVNPGEVNTQEIEDCLHEWTQAAYEAFEKSIQLSPASPYGYAAESQLFKECILLGKKLLNYQDYSFCETNSIYSDYSERLGNVLDLFEQICYAFKNDGLSQILPSYQIYESVRAFHQDIIGLNDESIQRYRTMYGSSSGEKKNLYGSLLVKSIVYSKKSSKDTRRAYSNLTRSERNEIERVLEYQKNQGDAKSYETLFMLKLYSPEEYSIDDAIDLLKEWENQYGIANQSGWGYLNACFYLAVCYSCKAIIGGVKNTELSSLAMTYFKKSEDFAKQFDKGTVQALCYFGEKSDIHCIVDKSRKDFEAYPVSGVIHKINNNNKGVLKLSCGLEVTFRADKKFDIMRDEGQSLCGLIGFSYSGPGLYDYRPDDANCQSDIFYEKQDETEITFEDLEKSYVPSEDLVEEEHPEVELTEAPKNSVKQVGFIDPSTFITSSTSKPANKNFKKSKLVDDNDYEGTIVIDGGYKKIKCDIYPYPLKIEDKNTDYYEDEVVIFTAKSRPNDRDANKTFWYATNVRLKED